MYSLYVRTGTSIFLIFSFSYLYYFCPIQWEKGSVLNRMKNFCEGSSLHKTLQQSPLHPLGKVKIWTPHPLPIRESEDLDVLADLENFTICKYQNLIHTRCQYEDGAMTWGTIDLYCFNFKNTESSKFQAEKLLWIWIFYQYSNKNMLMTMINIKHKLLSASIPWILI